MDSTTLYEIRHAAQEQAKMERDRESVYRNVGFASSEDFERRKNFERKKSELDNFIKTSSGDTILANSNLTDIELEVATNFFLKGMSENNAVDFSQAGALYILDENDDEGDAASERMHSRFVRSFIRRITRKLGN